MKQLKKFLVTIVTICVMISSINMTAFAAESGTGDGQEAISGSEIAGTVSGNDLTDGAAQQRVMMFRSAPRFLPAYSEVTELYLLSKVDGTPAFDADDAPGHDSSADNGILRTLDTVTYNLRMAIQVPENPSREGDADKVMIKSVIPGVKMGEVQFLTDSMGWLYEPEVTETAEGLTLTGYTLMDMTAENVYWQDLSFSLKAFDMEQGRKFAPQFAVWVDGQAVPGAVTEGTEVTVSAKEALNVGLLFAEDGRRGDFDLSLDRDVQQMKFGYLFGLSFRAELMTNAASLKGVLLPKDEITFDIEMVVKDTDAEGGPQDVTADHIPIVWDYTQYRTLEEGNGMLGRPIDGKASGVKILPYGEYNAEFPDRSVYESGQLTIVQEGNVLHVTIRDYDFGPEITFPKKSQSGNTFSNTQGVFSSGLIQLLIPYDNVPDNLLYSVETKLKNVKIGGNVMEQITESDDTATRQIQTISGSWNQYIAISHLEEFVNNDAVLGMGERGAAGSTQGDTYAYPGEELMFTGTFSTAESGCEFNGTDYLMKVPNVIELPEIDEIEVSATSRSRVDGYYPKSMNPFTDIKIRYAAKADGSYWISEQEMDDAFITDLVYYDSKEDAAAADAQILGLLFECRTEKNFIDKFRMLYVVPVKVSEAAEVGYVYPVAFEDCHYRIKVSDTENGMTTAHGISHMKEDNLDVVNQRVKELYDIAYSYYGKEAENTFHYRKWIAIEKEYGNFYAMPFIYVKSIYENGQVKAGTHVTKTSYSGTMSGQFGGNSILIVDTQASVRQSVEQTGTDGNSRSVFNLHQNQRVVDYVIQPEYKFPVEYLLKEEYDTLTITSTLDQGLTYIAGSSFRGGVYDTAAEELTGGTSMEPVISTDSAGRQVLTWVLENVKAGETIEPIHYSCSIDEGVGNGAQLSGTAKITAPSDRRPVTEATGKVSVTSIHVLQSRGAVLNKAADKEYMELVDELEYTISFVNHGNDTYEDILIKDILPYEGDGIGTDLKGGSYEVTGVELLGVDNGKLYVTSMDYEQIASLKDMYEDPYYAAGDLANSQFWKHWEEADAQTDLTGVTAVAARADVAAGQTLQIKIRLKVNFLVTKSVLFNNAEIYADGHQQLTSVKVRSITLPQRISGLAWQDADKDGIREAGESLLEGIKVTLLDETGAPAKDVWGDEVAPTVTDGQGAYGFDNLAKGSYQVVFEAGSFAMSDKKVSPEKATGSAVDTDCDAVGVYEGAVLTGARIIGIELPDLKDIAERDLDVLESGHWDLGLYEDHYYQITVNYLEKGTGTVLAEAYVSEEILEDTAYDVTDKSNTAIEGYTYDSIAGDALQGVIDSDKVINVYYTQNMSEEQPGGGEPSEGEEGDRPESGEEQPGNSGGSDTPENEQEIEDEQVPLGGAVMTDGLFMIDDPMVPLGVAPGTGDEAPITAMGAVCMAAGALLIMLLKKKRMQ